MSNVRGPRQSTAFLNTHLSENIDFYADETDKMSYTVFTSPTNLD
jgi:hypothetical protein